MGKRGGIVPYLVFAGCQVSRLLSLPQAGTAFFVSRSLVHKVLGKCRPTLVIYPSCDQRGRFSSLVAPGKTPVAWGGRKTPWRKEGAFLRSREKGCQEDRMRDTTSVFALPQCSVLNWAETQVTNISHFSSQSVTAHLLSNWSLDCDCQNFLRVNAVLPFPLID